MLEAAIAETGASAADCVMIGDTTYDMAMAGAAGVRALGVDWGYHSADELRGGGAEGPGEQEEDGEFDQSGSGGF